VQSIAPPLWRGTDPSRGRPCAVRRAVPLALERIEQQTSQQGSWPVAGGKLHEQFARDAV
jgi:hypothetical protein